MVDTKIKIAFKNYFKSLYGRLPSAEQLFAFQSYLLGKDDDRQKVEDVCGISLDGIETKRMAFKYQYEFVYDSIPTEEQLDVFIAFRLGVLKNHVILNDVCAKNKHGVQLGS